MLFFVSTNADRLVLNEGLHCFFSSEIIDVFMFFDNLQLKRFYQNFIFIVLVKYFFGHPISFFFFFTFVSVAIITVSLKPQNFANDFDNSC